MADPLEQRATDLLTKCLFEPDEISLNDLPDGLYLRLECAILTALRETVEECAKVADKISRARLGVSGYAQGARAGSHAAASRIRQTFNLKPEGE